MPNVEPYCLIKCKIYRAEDTDQESIWEKQGFRKGEVSVLHEAEFENQIRILEFFCRI